MAGIFASQAFVEFSTLLILVLTLGLAIIMSYRYVRKHSKPLLYWSTGMWFFAIGVFLEVIFAFGIYSEFLIALYLFVVVMVVESLAIGSIQLIKSVKLKSSYYFYSIITTVLLAYSLYASNIGNVITNHIVFGALPIFIVITSSIVTFPAAAILIAIAAISYLHRHSAKMLSIIAGVVVVSVAGTLYIAAIPAFLYYSEFIGILLLWLGFI
ncbi:MAG: hypothetical protein M1279_02665 [Candidatus Marsarchaeota archaeon]|nr:hypothetical protein [Candidatus Marsarchaeota archaeon]